RNIVRDQSTRETIHWGFEPTEQEPHRLTIGTGDCLDQCSIGRSATSDAIGVALPIVGKSFRQGCNSVLHCKLLTRPTGVAHFARTPAVAGLVARMESARPLCAGVADTSDSLGISSPMISTLGVERQMPTPSCYASTRKRNHIVKTQNSRYA